MMKGEPETILGDPPVKICTQTIPQIPALSKYNQQNADSIGASH